MTVTGTVTGYSMVLTMDLSLHVLTARRIERVSHRRIEADAQGAVEHG